MVLKISQTVNKTNELTKILQPNALKLYKHRTAVGCSIDSINGDLRSAT